MQLSTTREDKDQRSKINPLTLLASPSSAARQQSSHRPSRRIGLERSKIKDQVERSKINHHFKLARMNELINWYSQRFQSRKVSKCERYWRDQRSTDPAGRASSLWGWRSAPALPTCNPRSRDLGVVRFTKGRPVKNWLEFGSLLVGEILEVERRVGQTQVEDETGERLRRIKDQRSIWNNGDQRSVIRIHTTLRWASTTVEDHCRKIEY